MAAVSASSAATVQDFVNQGQGSGAAALDVFLTPGASRPPSPPTQEAPLFSSEQAARLTQMEQTAPRLYGSAAPLRPSGSTDSGVSSEAVQMDVRRQLSIFQAEQKAQMKALARENAALRRQVGQGLEPRASSGVGSWFRGVKLQLEHRNYPKNEIKRRASVLRAQWNEMKELNDMVKEILDFLKDYGKSVESFCKEPAV